MQASERAYKIIRRLIRTGVLPPDKRITEREVAGLCGMSRTPVREALQRMATENLLERRGASVFLRTLSRDDFIVMFELRCRIEAFAAGRAASQMTPEILEKLTVINGQIRSLVAASPIDHERFMDLNLDFHRTIAEIGLGKQFPMVARILENGLQHSSFRFLDDEAIERAFQEHVNIIRGLENKDTGISHDSMKMHIQFGFLDYRNGGNDR